MTRDEMIQNVRSGLPSGLVRYYDWVQRDAGFTLPEHLYPLALAWCDERIRNLMLIIGPGSGKSLALSQIFPSATIGNMPSENVICVSGAENLAQGFQDTVAAIVERQEAFQTCYPEVRPDKNRGWSSERGLFVSGHLGTVPDATYWAAGVSSTSLTGKHGSTLIFDDLHDDKNSGTPEQCAQIVTKYITQLSGRGDPMRNGGLGARKIIAGRRWNTNDLYGTLKDNGDWVVLELPFERPGQRVLWIDITVPGDLDCVFTDGKCKTYRGSTVQVVDQMPSEAWRNNVVLKGVGAKQVKLRHMQWPYGQDPKAQGFFWPASEAKRQEYFANKRMAPEQTEITYQCNPDVKSAKVFLESDFSRRYVSPDNLSLGLQDPAVKVFCSVGTMIVQSWDTAFSAESSSDYTVCTTMMLTPCSQHHHGEDETLLGPCDQHFDVHVLDVWREKLPFAGVEPAIRSQYMLWQPSWVIIEKRAYGVVAIETLSASLPIVPVQPSSQESKRDRVVNGIGAGSAQGWCRQGRVILPDDPGRVPWLTPFLDEVLGFTGQRGRTDDQVDSFVHGLRWVIQNGAGVVLPIGFETVEQVDYHMGAEVASQRPMLDMGAMMPIMFGDDDDPFADNCGRCMKFVRYLRESKRPEASKTRNLPGDFCMLHNTPTASLMSCEDHESPDTDLRGLFN